MTDSKIPRIRAFRELASFTTLGILAAYFYAGMEWLFFATKPSFMSAFDKWTVTAILIRAPLPLAVLSAALILLVFLGGLWGGKYLLRSGPALAAVVPALVLTLALVLLADNFTLTLFGFGIRSSSGVTRLLYSLAVLAVLVLVWRRLNRFRSGPRLHLLAAALVLLSLASLTLPGTLRLNSRGPANPGGNGQMPNVLLLSSDGLNARNLSAYGYSRETTPFLKSISGQSLFCENAFPNAGPTGASLVSVLNSKLPTRTGLIYPPDILQGVDSYQHLPLILRRLGYRSIQLSIRHYGDAYDSNLRESFDSANFRDEQEVGKPAFLGPLLGLESVYFLEQVQDRAASRVLHLLFQRNMEDVYEQVTTAKGLYQRDSTLLKEFFSFLEKHGDAPFLAQIHLIGTHGRTFHPVNSLFSRGKEQTQPWMTDFYDDSIRDFDDRLEEVFRGLREIGELHNTLIVIYSDHGQRFRTEERIPLLFFFPSSRPNGRIEANTQLIDIAPTILDYLRIPVPDWMQGRSLLQGDPFPYDPIISATRRPEATHNEGGLWKIDSAIAGPPFFSLGAVRVNICQESFFLELTENYLVVQDIPEHTAPCPEAKIPPPREVEKLILEHLRSSGYEISPERPPAAIHHLN